MKREKKVDDERVNTQISRVGTYVQSVQNQSGEALAIVSLVVPETAAGVYNFELILHGCVHA